MGNDLFAYISRLELMAFFAGYPIVYLLIRFFAQLKNPGLRTFFKKIAALLPFAYALTGTLFLGLQLRNMYPDYSLQNFAAQFQGHYLKIWGSLSLLFWIPVFNRRTIFSFLHSMVFFSLLLRDLFLQINSSVGNEVVRNDMNVYTLSILMNTITLIAISLIFFILKALNKNRPLHS